MRHLAQRRNEGLGLVSMRVALLLALLSLSHGSFACARRPPACSSENLLDRDTPLRSRGVIREQWMVDGSAPAPGSRVRDFDVAFFVSPRAHVTYDLGRIARVGAIQIATNNHAPGLVSHSIDGVHYSRLSLENDLESPGPGELFVRHIRSPDLRLRYLRIAMERQDRGRAVAEVLAFCRAPAQFPARLEVPETRDQRRARLQSREQAVNGLRVGLALALLVLSIARRDRLRAHPRAVAIALIVLGALSWLRFGDLLGDGRLIHPWDATHYYLGSKYFRELGYSELYRCIARHERERGRGAAIDPGEVRNLDNYVLYPGTWTATPDGACRAQFTPERWRAFGQDVDRLRRIFVTSRFAAALEDHGYNATPIHTAWLMPLTNHVASDRSGLTLLAALDLVAVAAAAAALWWAFGPLAAGLAVIVLGLGTPWSVLWIGGSIGRLAWLGLLCVGLALLKKEHLTSGAALITLSGLIRLFPLVFVGAMLLKVFVDAFRDRGLGRDGGKLLLGMAIAVLLGGGAAVAQGVGTLAEFRDNSALHAMVPPKANHLGLGVVASLGSEGSALEALRYGDRSAGVLTGVFLWATGLLAAAAFLLRQVQRPGRATWESVCLAGPLLYASIPLAGYDYAWLLVLVPVCVASTQRVAMLLLGLAAMDIGMSAGASVAQQHVLASALVGVLLVAVFWHEQRAGTAR